ncbi:hypothetical protein XELAEV_18020809mg [Xenopus laevis]|uniref:Uncharacterized protein n=1 Tax=Xenopus laevis TaxID=8355 RepID=A0A974D998_XENLA|nr:hypothetical protein XELAEV_18020809mg [Xenopus laevis]
MYSFALSLLKLKGKVTNKWDKSNVFSVFFSLSFIINNLMKKCGLSFKLMLRYFFNYFIINNLMKKCGLSFKLMLRYFF